MYRIRAKSSKVMHNLCTENYKALLKNIKEGQNKLGRYTTFTGEKN